jgi:hypothetical protein
MQKVSLLALNLSDNGKQDEVDVVGNVFVVIVIEGVVLNVVSKEIRMKWNGIGLSLHDS